MAKKFFTKKFILVYARVLCSLLEKVVYRYISQNGW